MAEDRMQKIVEKIFRKHTHSQAEVKKIFTQIKRFSAILQKELENEKIAADVFHGGSSAKGTFLKGNFDVDLFVRFDYSRYKNFSSKLSDILHLAVERATNNNFERIHGSRDYFQHKYKHVYPINFEIVPVLKIDKPSDAKNVTDCSPLHVLWLKERMTRQKDLVKQSVAAKIFMKAIKTYGAESYIKGFSGHVLDILVSHFGSFERLLVDSHTWENHHVIDVENHYEDKDQAIKHLAESKLSPLIVIDPIQPERNAAAALSKEKLELFRRKAKEVLVNPKMSFFTLPRFSLTALKRENVPHCDKAILKISPKETKRDIAGSKLLKFYERLLSYLKRNGFDVFDSGWDWPNKDAYIWLYVTKNSISFVRKNPDVVREGPPKQRKEDVKRFKEKHSSCFWHQGKIYAKVPRKFVSYRDIIHKTIKEESDKGNIVYAKIIS